MRDLERVEMGEPSVATSVQYEREVFDMESGILLIVIGGVGVRTGEVWIQVFFPRSVISF